MAKLLGLGDLDVFQANGEELEAEEDELEARRKEIEDLLEENAKLRAEIEVSTCKQGDERNQKKRRIYE